MPLHQGAKVIAVQRVGETAEVEHQPGVWQAAQNLAPDPEGMVVQPLGAAGIGKRDSAAGQAGWRRRQVSLHHRLERHETMRQAHDVFARDGLWGCDMGVKQHIVDRRQAGGPCGAQPCHLQRRGLFGEYPEPVVAHVVAAVDQDVYAVGAHQRCHLVVAQIADVAPVIKHGPEFCREGIFHLDVGVGEYLDHAVVMVGKKRQEIETRGVLAKVGRHVANPQPSGHRTVMLTEVSGRQGEAVTPAHELGKDVGHRQIGVVGERIQALFPQHRVFRQYRQRCVGLRHHLMEVGQLRHDTGQALVRMGLRDVEARGAQVQRGCAQQFQRPAKTSCRFHQTHLFITHLRQMAVRGDVVGLDGQALLVQLRGFCVPVLPQHGRSQVDEGCGETRAQLQRQAQIHFGLYRAALVVQRKTQVAQRTSVCRRNSHRFLQRLQRLPELAPVDPCSAQRLPAISDLRELPGHGAGQCDDFVHAIGFEQRVDAGKGLRRRPRRGVR